MSDLLTTDEVARAMRVSRKTVMRMIRDGRLPASKFGRQWRVSAAALRTSPSPTQVVNNVVRVGVGDHGAAKRLAHQTRVAEYYRERMRLIAARECECGWEAACTEDRGLGEMCARCVARVTVDWE